MKKLLLLAAATSLSAFGFGQTILYDKMTGATGGIIQSAWWEPNGTDYDVYTWDDFTLTANSTVNEVYWRGAGPDGISGFSIRFYESIGGGSQPKITALPENETPADYLKGYDVSGIAGATAVPGTSLFEYHYSLPTSLTLQGNTKYWVKVTANMTTFPFWGMATSTSALGDGRNFRYFTGGPYFLPGNGDTAFQLRGTTTVPEPSTLVAAGIGLSLLVRRRFRKKES